MKAAVLKICVLTALTAGYAAAHATLPDSVTEGASANAEGCLTGNCIKNQKLNPSASYRSNQESQQFVNWMMDESRKAPPPQESGAIRENGEG